MTNLILHVHRGSFHDAMQRFRSMDFHGAHAVYEKIVGEQAESSISDQPSGHEGANRFILELFGPGHAKSSLPRVFATSRRTRSAKAVDFGSRCSRSGGLANVRGYAREEERIWR
jgi:hypothetical protein